MSIVGPPSKEVFGWSQIRLSSQTSENCGSTFITLISAACMTTVYLNQTAYSFCGWYQNACRIVVGKLTACMTLIGVHEMHG